MKKLSKLTSKLKVSSLNGSVGVQLNTGVFQVTAQLGLAADRKLDVLESARSGVSVCNIGQDMAMLDVALGKLIQVKTEVVKGIRDVVDTIQSHASMLQAHGVTTLQGDLSGYSDSGIVLLSVLLSVVKVLGREAAVTVTRCFIEKLGAAEGDPVKIDKTRLESMFKTLIRDVEAGGSTWLTSKSQTYDAVDKTDGKENFSELRFAKVTYGMMVSLIWWLYESVKVGHDGHGPQACKSYDTRLHKVVFLLEQFGWPIHAAWSKRTETKTDEDLAQIPRVMFEAHVCGEGVEDFPLLQADEVDKHSLNVPESRIVCKYKDIGKVLRALIGSEYDLGVYAENGWEEGWKRAMSVEFKVYSRERGLTCHARVAVPFQYGEIGSLLKSLRTELNSTLECLRKDYEDYFSWMGGGFDFYFGPDRNQPESRFWESLRHLRSESMSEMVSQAMSKVEIKYRNITGQRLAGAFCFLLGYLCGSIFQLSVKLGLTIKDDVTLSWLGNVPQFLQDLDDVMTGFYGAVFYAPSGTGINRTETNGMTIGRCLGLIAVCFYGETQTLGDICRGSEVEEYNIVGTWAGDKVLLLNAVMNPTMNFERNCQILELDSLPINIPCRNGKYIRSAKRGFNRSEVQPTYITSRAEPLKADFFQPPLNPISITVGPNFIDSDGSVMHSIYSRNRLIHCSSILDAFIPFLEKWKDPDELPSRETEKWLYLRNRLKEYTEDSSFGSDDCILPVSDVDLIERGALVPPLEKRPHKIALVQVHGNDLWRYTATSTYYNGSLRNYYDQYKENKNDSLGTYGRMPVYIL